MDILTIFFATLTGFEQMAAIHADRAIFIFSLDPICLTVSILG